jgi:hypothetical protein
MRPEETSPHVSISRTALTSAGRLLCRMAVVALLLWCLGCASTPGPLRKLPTPFGSHANDQALRKQVEADSFPTAKQAGL